MICLLLFSVAAVLPTGTFTCGVAGGVIAIGILVVVVILMVVLVRLLWTRRKSSWCYVWFQIYYCVVFLYFPRSSPNLKNKMNDSVLIEVSSSRFPVLSSPHDSGLARPQGPII